MKLLIVVKWYPPDLRVPARRWGNLVAELQKAGARCTVVAAGDGRASQQSGPAHETVFRLPISNIDSTASAVGSKNMRKAWRKRVRQAVLAAVPPMLREFDVRHWLRQTRSSPELLDLAAQSDCIISSYGPLGPLMLGRQLALTTKKPWIADVRDALDFKDGFVIGPARSVSRALERRILGQAKLRTTVGVTLAEYLRELYGLSFEAIYNGWSDADLLDATGQERGDERYLYYAGSIYHHRIPALRVVLGAISMRSDVCLKIRLLKDHTAGALRQSIEEFDLSDRVQLLPPVSQDVVDRELCGSLGALVLEDIAGTDAVMNGIVTGKLLGLLASGVKGIAVSAPTGEIRHLIEDVTGWHGVDSVEQCANAIADLIASPGRVDNSAHLREFHMSQQAERLMGFVSTALSGATA